MREEHQEEPTSQSNISEVWNQTLRAEGIQAIVAAIAAIIGLLLSAVNEFRSAPEDYYNYGPEYIVGQVVISVIGIILVLPLLAVFLRYSYILRQIRWLGIFATLGLLILLNREGILGFFIILGFDRVFVDLISIFTPILGGAFIVLAVGNFLLIYLRGGIFFPDFSELLEVAPGRTFSLKTSQLGTSTFEEEIQSHTSPIEEDVENTHHSSLELTKEEKTILLNTIGTKIEEGLTTDLLRTIESKYSAALVEASRIAQ